MSTEAATNLASIAGVYAGSSDVLPSANALSQHLSLPLLTQPPVELDAGQFVLCCDAEGIALHFTGPKSPSPITVDFTRGASAHRRQFGGGKSQLIAKAVGIKGGFRPQVVDVTAGLGQDAFVLATLGCSVTLLERMPVVHVLLADGLARAQADADPGLMSIVERMVLHQADGLQWLTAANDPIDVIYLDPMFPERSKSAQVKKSMAAFHLLVGRDEDGGQLLAAALKRARYRVVVKRPRKAPGLHEQFANAGLEPPGLVLSGKSSRYDIYPLQKMPT